VNHFPVSIFHLPFAIEEDRRTQRQNGEYQMENGEWKMKGGE
jgi:hypothetical protein